MPAAWRVHAIDRRLRAEGIEARVVECDLYSLEGLQRQAAVDAMVAGEDPPMVLVGEELACAGDLDLARVVEVAIDLSR